MDTEQIPVTVNNEQISATEPITPTPNIEIKKASKNGPVVVILVILVIALMCGLTYFVLKDRGIDLLSGIIKDTNSNTDTNTTDETENNTCDTDSETTNDCKMKLDNSGWALFSMPEYGYSVEVPSYSAVQELNGGEDVKFVWSFGQNTVKDSPEATLISNYLRTASISYYPIYIPEGVACGGFCLDQHEFRIHAFQNSNGKTLAQVSQEYIAGFNANEASESVSISTGKMVSKWETEVFEYEVNYTGADYMGYIVVTKDYIFNMIYHISSEPAASVQIAQKVLDSMKFEIIPEISVSTIYMGDAGAISKKYASYDYFLGDSATKAYLVDKDDITLDSTKIGKMFTLKYSEVAKEGSIGSTDYYSIEGTFTYDQQ